VAIASEAVLAAALSLASLLAGPSCPMPRIPVPAVEPRVVAGPTELISGLYLQGGPAPPIGCHPEPRGPLAGTLSVYDARSGRRVARETLHSAGHLFAIALHPGTYRVTATESGGLRTRPATVTITPHHTVRRDVFLDVQ
jgi:hypothetical protein